MAEPIIRGVALIVAGPTCSGKSALAMDMARRHGGVVINADSMQVYRELRILSARPDPAAEAACPHRLYGVRPAAEPGHVGWWRGAALDAMQAANADGHLPILCGGTGLYLQALREGLAEIPDPGDSARVEALDLLQRLGASGLHARLAEADPRTAGGLRPSDGQRVARAWAVWRGTGRGLAVSQAGSTSAPAPYRFVALRLDPPRAQLRAAIRARFLAMVAAGALAEVAALLALNLDPALPAMRALGVPDLVGVLRGTCDLPAAIDRACMATGQYTKRQATWFRHRRIADPADTHTIDALYRQKAQVSETLDACSDNIRRSGS